MYQLTKFIADTNNNHVPDGLEALHAVAKYLKRTLLPTLRDVATATTATVVAFIALGDELRRLFDLIVASGSYSAVDMVLRSKAL